jgi:hypothetical protein
MNSAHRCRWCLRLRESSSGFDETGRCQDCQALPFSEFWEQQEARRRLLGEAAVTISTVDWRGEQ